MTKQPTIEHRAEQPTVFIPVEVTMQAFGPAIAAIDRVFAWLGERGIAPAGPPFFRYTRLGDMDGPMRVEVGVPVAAPVPGDGRVVAGAIPAGRYATLLHTGHPDRLVAAHAALHSWIADQRLAFARDGDAWDGRFEFFLTDPDDQPDPEQWSTEVAYLLRPDAAAETDLPRDIGRPALRALIAAGYTRLVHLAGANEADLLALHGVGPRAIGRLRQALAAEGLAFAADPGAG